MSDREDAIYDRLDSMASSLEEECEIVALICVRENENGGGAFIATSTRGNTFEIIGLLESVKKEMLEKTT